MKFAAIIKIEGALTKDTVISGAATVPAAILTRGMASQMQLFFLTESSDRRRVLEWLQVELGVVAPKIIGPEDDDPITTVRYLGWDVQFYVDQQPSAVAEAMRKGVVGVVFAAPEYQRPEFRPDARDGAPREWASIEAEQQRQRETRATDQRTTDDFRDQRFGD